MGRMIDALKRMQAENDEAGGDDPALSSIVTRVRPGDEDGPVEAPWAFGDARVAEREGADGRKVRRLVPLAPVPSRRDQGPLHDHLIGLVQRTFLAPPGDTPAIRAAVFAGVDTTVDSAPLSMGTAELLASYTSATVCLVDANVRAPSLHTTYGLDNPFGFAEVLAGDRRSQSAARPVMTSGSSSLWLLSAGSSPADDVSLLSRDPASRSLRELLGEFDFVVFQAPPVALHPAAAVLGSLTDGVILVVDAQSTRRASARVAMETLKASDTPVLGAVLQNRTFPIPDAIYRRL